MPEYFWGENLSGCGASYRISRNRARWFTATPAGPGLAPYMHYLRPDFPSSMPSVWHEHFGFLLGRSDATVVVGEWGGPLNSQEDASWQRELVDYLVQNGHVSFYWCLTRTQGTQACSWTTGRRQRAEAGRPEPPAQRPSTKLMRGNRAFPCIGSGLGLTEGWPMPVTPLRQNLKEGAAHEAGSAWPPRSAAMECTSAQTHRMRSTATLRRASPSMDPTSTASAASPLSTPGTPSAAARGWTRQLAMRGAQRT